MIKPLHEHIKNMLLLAKKIISDSPLLIDEIGSTNAKGDKTIGMDSKIENEMIRYIKENDIPAHIFSEEVGMVKFHSKPEYLITFDPLDGSTNYKVGKNIFPYGFLVAAYDELSPKLGDVITSGAIEFTHNLAWIFKDQKTYLLDDSPVEIKNDWNITKSTPVYLDLYYKEGYETYSPLAQQVFIRNMGSTIGNLSYVLSNIAAALGGVCMRPEEIGTITSLIKGAGGVVVDHGRNNLNDMPFSPEKTYQILAGNKNVVDFMVDKLKH